MSHLHAVVAACMQGGLFSCSLPLDAIINGRERRAAQPIRSLLACQPKTNCLLALTAAFYLHNSNPKAKANLHSANSERRSRVCGSAHAGRSGGASGEGRWGGSRKKGREKKKTPRRIEPNRSRINRGHAFIAPEHFLRARSRALCGVWTRQPRSSGLGF